MGGDFIPENVLMKTQRRIEQLTMEYDEGCIWRTASGVVSKLTRDGECSARDFLKTRKNLSDDDLEMFNLFKQYTIEFLAVHVLSFLFSPLDNRSHVRAATFVEHLESLVRKQTKIRRDREDQNGGSEVGQIKKIKYRTYPIGTGIAQFLVSRGIISLKTEGGEHPAQKKYG